MIYREIDCENEEPTEEIDWYRLEYGIGFGGSAKFS